MPKGEVEFLTLLVSALAFVISLAALIISVQQKKKDEIRETRKHLSDTLNELAKVNVSFSQMLVNNVDNANNEVVELRRNLNGQRRILLTQADLLVKKNTSIATETDSNLIAVGFDIIGNYPEAENYWKLTIEKSNDYVIKHMNMRGYAGFLFRQGNIEAGRGKFKESLELRMPDTENVRRIVTDTYLIWASSEMNFGFDPEVSRIIYLAQKSCDRISHKRMNEDMQKRIVAFKRENQL